MIYETLVPSAGWLLGAAAAALLVLFAVVQTIRLGGIAQVRNATLFPVLAALVFLLGFHGKDLDLKYSARPLARQMQQQAPDVRLVAVRTSGEIIVYGLAFYRNEEPIDYQQGRRSAQANICWSSAPAIRRSWNAGWPDASTSHCFSTTRRALKCIKVYPKQ